MRRAEKQESAQALAKLLSDPTATIREGAALGIRDAMKELGLVDRHFTAGQWPSGPVLDAVRKQSLVEAEAKLAGCLAEILALVHDYDALLKTALDAHNPCARFSALRQLAAHYYEGTSPGKASEILPVLADICEKDPDAEVRGAAAYALARIVPQIPE